MQRNCGRNGLWLSNRAPSVKFFLAKQISARAAASSWREWPRLSAAALPEIRGAPGRCGRSGRADYGVSERRQGLDAHPLGERLHRPHCLGCGSRRLRRVGTYAGFTVVYAVGTEPPQDGYSKGWPSNVHIAVCKQPQPNKRNGRAHVPAGTSQGIRSADAKPQRLSTRRSRWNGGYAGAPVAGLTRIIHERSGLCDFPAAVQL